MEDNLQTEPSSDKSDVQVEKQTALRSNVLPEVQHRRQLWSLYIWDKASCSGLAYEVVRNIYKGQEKVDTFELARDIRYRLMNRLNRLNICVAPDVYTMKCVAKNVHRELCRKQKAEWVAAGAMTDDGIRTSIVDIICTHLKTMQINGLWMDVIASNICPLCPSLLLFSHLPPPFLPILSGAPSPSSLSLTLSLPRCLFFHEIKAL
ncbi:hypothetical protein WMY93_029036 [Mugilogobius chulae]|uniref:Uncharacterized protein n=1 Tax=Mugilogobius chulae TaxID=88201 RepID=A0AAW0MQ18_9GOBI